MKWAIVLGLGVLVTIVLVLSLAVGLDDQLGARGRTTGACYVASGGSCRMTTRSICIKRSNPAKYGYYWDKGRSCIRSSSGIGVLAHLESGTGFNASSLFREQRADCIANLRARLAEFDGCPSGTSPAFVRGPSTNYIFHRDNSYESPDSSNSLLNIFKLIPDLTIEGETGCSALVECVPRPSPSPTPSR